MRIAISTYKTTTAVTGVGMYRFLGRAAKTYAQPSMGIFASFERKTVLLIDSFQKSSPEFVYYVMVGDRDSDIVAAKNSLRASQTKTIAITTTQQAFSAKPDRYLKMASRITDNLLKELLKGRQVK